MKGSDFRRQIVVLVSLCALAVGASAAAQPNKAKPSQHFEQASKALDQGRYENAINHLEAYADRESPHPDASYNRGIAYLMRVRSGNEASGDLGRAAASFEEALALRPGDIESKHALELVRAEVARRRSRAGQNVVVASPSLDRVVVGFFSARTFNLLALGASLLLALGLVLRKRKNSSQQLTGTLLSPLAGLALVGLVPLSIHASTIARSRGKGVVVVREAFLVDENGRPLGGDPVTEATTVEIGARRGSLLHLRYGRREGWVKREAIRIIQRPPAS
jgi:LPXTG-motif cell wall-anchored protein